MIGCGSRIFSLATDLASIITGAVYPIDGARIAQ